MFRTYAKGVMAAKPEKKPEEIACENAGAIPVQRLV